MKGVFGLIALLLGGCVSAADVSKANYAIEASWQKELDGLVQEYGSRTYDIPRAVCMRAMSRTAQGLGLVIEERDWTDGTLLAAAIAPKPLSEAEWSEVARFEEPRMKEIIAREIGPASAALWHLAPEKYRILFAAAFRSVGEGTRISMAGRMEYLGTAGGAYFPKSPPPTAARLALIKIWNAFDEELRLAGYETKAVREPTRAKPVQPGI